MAGFRKEGHKYKAKCLFVTLALRIFNATLCSKVVCKQASIECRPVAMGVW